MAQVDVVVLNFQTCLINKNDTFEAIAHYSGSMKNLVGFVNVFNAVYDPWKFHPLQKTNICSSIPSLEPLELCKLFSISITFNGKEFPLKNSLGCDKGYVPDTTAYFYC